jgi:pyruvate dehydrogenase E2 component (dihydrolipoamide acetyltransferase)
LLDYARLMSFYHTDHVFRYRKLDIGFVVRTPDGRLYTPVVRGVDRLDVKEIARRCLAAGLSVNHGRVRPEDLDGACFTVSHITTRGLTRFTALPGRFQSAILAVAPERSLVTLSNGQVSHTPVSTLTLSYDHTLCDGVYAAEFLDRLAEEMESVVA